MTGAFGIEEKTCGTALFMQVATLYLHKGSAAYGHNEKLA